MFRNTPEDVALGESGLLDTLGELGVGCIAFSPLAQGLLTDKYISGDAASARARDNDTFKKDFLSEVNLRNVRGLAGVARRRGQTLAQMAIVWGLRDARVAQLDDSLDALKNLEFSAEELKEIDQFARRAASISGATSLCCRHATWNARCAS